MADQSPVDAALISSFMIQDRVQTAISSLAIYEYIITIEQEVSTIWKRRVSVASLLLFSVRFGMLLEAVITLITDSTISNLKSCEAMILLNTIAILSLLIATAVFSALRVYALCDRNIALAGVVFLLQSTSFGVNIYVAISTSYEGIPGIGCAEKIYFDTRTETMLVRIARIPAIFGDVLVIAVTWFKSYQQLRVGRGLEIPTPLSSLLFRDGTAYFLALLAVNLLELCADVSQTDKIQSIAQFCILLPPILVNRFLLNLRQLGDTGSSGHLCTISTPMFRMNLDVTGNLGESLDHGWGEEGDRRERGEVAEASGAESG